MPRKRRKKSVQSHDDSLDEDMAASIRDKITHLFNKKFTLKDKHQTWTLPDKEYLFKDELFAVPELLTLKEDLNSTKSLLNDKDIDQWHQHTRKMHKGGLVVRHLREQTLAEMCTQAWAKFHEIVASYELLPTQALETRQLNSVHLCEAPGAFIASLNHYLRNKVPQVHWQWVGTTLNPYHEGNDVNAMLDDDSFIQETMGHWNFGADGTGDIMNLKNLKSLKEDCDKALGAVNLVTADGSIDCADNPGEQERAVGQLIWCEALAAMEILFEGGNYVFKMFTALECHIITMMYLLCCVFREIHFVKPGTSKAGNSEVYVVCIHYCGTLPSGYKDILYHTSYRSEAIQRAVIPLRLIPTEFIRQLKECQQLFVDNQKQEILENIQHFYHMNKLEKRYLFQIRNKVALHYCNLFDVKPLKDSDRIIARCYLNGVSRTQGHDVNVNEQFSNRNKTGTYNDRHQNDKSWLDSMKHHGMFAFNQSACISLSGLCQTDGVQLVPLSPDQILWLVSTGEETKLSLKITTGKIVTRVLHSRFCSSYYITTLNTAIKSASILESSLENALVQILKHSSPYFTVVDQEGCCYCGCHPVVLDRLVELTDIKPGELDPCVVILDSKSPCHCWPTYLQSRDIKVHNCTEGKEGIQALGQVDMVIVPHCNSIPSCAWKSIGQPLEIMSKKEFLECCIAGLKQLKPGGTFVCRLFTSLTRFTVGLLYILHLVFKQLAIVKPVVGFLWHPERFLVCKGYRGCGQEVLAHLERVSTVMTSCREDEDVLEITDMECLFEEKFFRFVKTMNERLSHLQILDIVRLETFNKFPSARISNEQMNKLNKEIIQHFKL